MGALLGYREDEALGRRCEDLLGLERIGALTDGDALDGESTDVTVRTKDGTTKALRLRTGAIRDEEGAPPARIVVVRDAGEERKAEQIKRDFVSMVSHELRSPLTPLRGFLVSLVEGTVDDDPETRLEYYRIMLRQTQRLERVVNDMLDASLIEAGGLVVDLQPAPLDHILGRIVREFREQRPDRPVVLHDSHRPSIVFADPFRVEQVVLNLLSNADKYTPDGSPIDVEHGNVERIGHGLRPRHRARHPPGAPAPDLRPLLPGEGRRGGRSPRHGTRAVHRTDARRGDVRTDLGRLGDRDRHDLLVQPPDRRRRPLGRPAARRGHWDE